MAALARCTDAELRSWESVLGVNLVQMDQAGALTRQRHTPNNFANNNAKSFHSSSSPSSPHQHGAERDVHQLEQNPQSLKDRLHSAMRRRIGPGTGLTVKMVARATGLTERTIENAMSGGSIPRSDTMHTLLCFFDASFANEVFAGANFMVVKLSDHRAVAAARQVLEGAQILADLQRSGA